MGVEYKMVEKSVAVLNNVPQGAYVARIVADSPAEKAGLKEGDIITNTGGDLAKMILAKKPGEKLDLEIYRDGESLKLSATLSESEQ